MNAFIAAVIEKKTILTANEGRLLKKSFLGFVILIMAFQVNDFGDVVRQALIDAYLQVSVFVGFTSILCTNVMCIFNTIMFPNCKGHFSQQMSVEKLFSISCCMILMAQTIGFDRNDMYVSSKGTC